MHLRDTISASTAAASMLYPGDYSNPKKKKLMDRLGGQCQSGVNPRNEREVRRIINGHSA